MGKTVLSTAIQQLSVRPPAPATAPVAHSSGWLKKTLTQVLLRITVVLFALSLLLVLAGTLAQIDAGINTVVDQYFRSLYVWIPFQIFFPRKFVVSGGFPYPGGWLLGGLLLVTLLAAHIVSFKLTWKRSGILLLHAGVVVMMLGELFTGLFAVEGRMTIGANGASNFVESYNATELAIVSPADAKTDNVVVIPGAKLRKGGLIQDNRLPFDVEVLRYMPNSDEPVAPEPGSANPATAGEGLALVTHERREGSGVDAEQKMDVASAYVTFKKKGSGEALGTYLMSVWLALAERSQQVTVDGKAYDVALRFKRTYRPYTIYLEEFHHDRYMGTDKPKNYSSLVRLVDAEHNQDREALIYMNEPLRYGGETFYQIGMTPINTTLQVVRNPSWLLPYISCAMVAVGMLVHFGIMLISFLRRVKIPALQTQPPTGGWSRFLPWGIAGVTGAYLLILMLPPSPSSSKMNLDEFGKIPIVDGGRVKPIDTLARINLMIVSERQTFKDESDHEQPAVKWLLDVMTSNLPGNGTPNAEKEKVFRIDNDQLLNFLGLPARPRFYRYSVAEISPKIKEFEKESDRAHKIDPKDRDLFDTKVVKLAQQLHIYIELARLQGMLAVPPEAGSADQEWQPFLAAVAQQRDTGVENPAVRSFGKILFAYKDNNAEEFNREVANYHKLLGDQFPSEVRTAGFETFFNRVEPFYQCSILYAFVILLTCLSWAGFTRPLNRAAFWLVVVTLVVHTFALISRMYIQGRPPVTNLYSSAIFIGWGCVIMCLILEMAFGLGIGNLLAGVLGFATVLISHLLATDGDTLEMMQAVLDTNFWLATHVTCVTFGYAATFLAGFLGIIYLILMAANRPWNKNVLPIVGKMIHGIVCFAMLLSFTGTVLGGIWADQSWGRFWGWDPKENGALIIVIWNALILHARWGGMVHQAGVALLAVFGNIVTAWSWFGVNMLGVGLHAYGFMNGAAYWLSLFMLSQLGLIIAGGVAKWYWQTRAKPPTRRFA
jgi:ABC-type transport system involved in cytochrome c biogenesis permease subunit